MAPGVAWAGGARERPHLPMCRLVYPLGLALAVAALLPARVSARVSVQETSPDPVAPASNDEARRIAEWIPEALEENDLDAAREMLHEAVEALQERGPGEEEAQGAFLLELDGYADRLGSLEESRRLRERVLELRRDSSRPTTPIS